MRINSEDNQGVVLRGLTARRLLGVLLLTPGEWVSDDRLTELAWGPMGATRAALHNAVSRLRGWLRASLGDGGSVTLEHSAARYRIVVPQDRIDVGRFCTELEKADRQGAPGARVEHLLAALGEWRGPVLADTSDWIRADPVVTGLEKQRLERTCELADLALETGRPNHAFPFVAELAAALAYDEPLQARLLALLGAAGRRAEALRHYEQLRRGLADELGVDPSLELREIHLGLLRVDAPGSTPPTGTNVKGGAAEPPVSPAVIAERIAEHPALPAPVTPAMLPRDIVDFTGREAESTRMCRFLGAADERPAVEIMVVSGKPGVGTSSLAVHAAHLCRADAPEGQLYADLGGTAGAPLPPGEVLAQFLRALGAGSVQLPGDLAERSALYRTRLSGRRMLIVLDNAADEAQVRPLLPGDPRCRVLVTSRRRLPALEGAHQLDLDVLAPAESVRLLARVGGASAVAAEPRAAREVVDICGHLPLAVRAAGLRLAGHPHRGLGWLADLLADERHRIGELALADVALQTSMRLSYDALDGEERRLFRWAGLLASADFTASMVGRLIGRPVPDTERLLEQLLHAHLLEARPAGPEGEVRYRFHELIRVYARERAINEMAEGEPRQVQPRTAPRPDRWMSASA